jgi:asparagine synthase (glutamine-hydrolysing)
MCGIAGYVHKSDCSPACIEIENLSHKNQSSRGPDNHASWVHKSARFTVHLFHQRLRIQDLSSAADQPTHSQGSEKIHLVFNGEIYNANELKNALIPNLTLKTHSDTEILAEMLALHQTIDVLSNIRGMFAIGGYNSQNETLELIRDYFGEKPLHYTFGDDFILFASQFDTIVDSLKKLGHPPELDQISIYKYLIMGYFPFGSSLYKNVLKLPTGSVMRFDLNSKTGFSPIVSRWSPEWKAKGQATASEAQLEQVLTSAVSEQLIGDVPLGVLLSGGVDSTLVTALAQKCNSEPMHSFSVGFPETDFDESKYALRAAEELGTQHHALIMSPEDAAAILPEVLRAFPEPLGDPSVFPTTFISREAQKYVTVVLTGDGADELFFGYRRYGRFLKLQKLKERRRVILRCVWLILFLASRIHSKFKNDFLRISQVVNDTADIDTYLTLVGFKEYESASNMELFELTFKKLKQELAPLQFLKNPENNLREMDVESYLVDNILVKVDRAGMAFGLETRAPFLDMRVADLAASAPRNWLIKNEQKLILKEILSGYVSNEIFRRTKMGFGAPMGGWFRTTLKLWGAEIVESFEWEKIGVSSSYVHNLWEQNQQSTDESATYLWILLSLAASVERFS